MTASRAQQSNMKIFLPLELENFDIIVNLNWRNTLAAET